MGSDDRTVHEDGGTCGCGTPDKSNLELHRGRSCQDFPVTVLFIAYMIGVAVIAGWAVDNGDADRLIYGADSWGNICGRSDNERHIENANSGLDLSGHSHHYYTLANEERSLCLSTCPSVTTFCANGGSGHPDCVNAGICLGQGNTPYKSETFGSSCPDLSVASTQFSYIRRCVPIDSSNSSLVSQTYARINAASWSEQLLSDFYAARYVILVALLVSAAVTLFCILSMRCLAGIIVWGAIFASVVAVLALSGAIWYFGIKESIDNSDKEDKGTLRDTDTTNANWMLVSAAFVSLIAILYICLVCAMRNRIHQSIVVLKATSRALMKILAIFFCPCVSAVLLIGWGAVWITLSMYVLTADTISMDETTGYVVYEDHDKIHFIWAYLIFALFWGVQLIIAAEEFTVASSMTQWYLSHGKPEGWVILRSIYRIFRYHFGSLAYGALLVAIVQMLRVIVEYINKKIEDATNGDPGCFMRFFMCCTRCCLYCFEKCIRWINKNAYIEIAIWGDGFMSSACRTMGTMSEFVPLVAVATSVEWLVVTFIKMFVTFSAGFVSYLYLEPEGDDISMYGFVVAFIIIMAFVVCDTFTDIFEMGASSLFLLVMEDYRDSKKTGKTYMTKRLKEAWPLRAGARSSTSI